MINSLYLSNNGHYLINNERIYFAKEQKSYLFEDLDPMRWLDVLSENSQFSLKNNLIEIKELFSTHRKITYQLFEDLSLDEKSHLMLEYESKFGNMLLTEDIETAEGFLGNAWDWTKNKVKSAGGFWLKTGKDVLQCVTKGNCVPFFEDYREMLFSPAGIALDAFLMATGFAAPAPMIAWGIMLLWDVYLLISGSPEFSWLNLIFDILGVGLGVFAKAARSIFTAAGLVGKTAGKTLPEVITMAMKNPETAGVIKKIVPIAKNGLPKVMDKLNIGAKFLSEKLNATWAGKALNSVSEQLGKILESIGVSSRKVGVTTAQGVKSGLMMGGIAQGITTGVKKIRGNSYGNEDELIKSLQTSGPTEYIDGVDF